MYKENNKSQSSIFGSCDKALPVFELEHETKKEQSQGNKK